MKITLVRDDGKVNTLRTLKIELLLEQMKTEVKAQPVSKMREALRYTLPGNSIEGVDGSRRDKGISQRVSANVPRFHRLLR